MHLPLMRLIKPTDRLGWPFRSGRRNCAVGEPNISYEKDNYADKEANPLRESSASSAAIFVNIGDVG